MTHDEIIFKRNVLPFLRPHRQPDGAYKSPSRIWVSTFSGSTSTLVTYDVENGVSGQRVKVQTSGFVPRKDKT